MNSSNKMKQSVREFYGKIATENGATNACGSGLCCGSSHPGLAQQAEDMGYSPQDIQAAPEGANLGLGCGNPHLAAILKPGEWVLDLGSGAGFDGFIAARAVGPQGRVIGVDMTPEMIAKARRNAEQAGLANIEFRLGEIEHLPVPDQSVDVVISNCVINLSQDKPAVFREVLRVLKPGGRLAISDILALAPLPETVRNNPELVSCCIGGAETGELTRSLLEQAGFEDIRIQWAEPGDATVKAGVTDLVRSALIQARKPGVPRA